VCFVGSLIVIPPNANNIRRWHNQLSTTECLCKGKSLGRPRVSEENVQRVRDAFVRSPKKSVRKASCELAMPVMTVWKVLRKILHMHPYRLQLLQALKPIVCAQTLHMKCYTRKMMTFSIVLCSVMNQHFILMERFTRTSESGDLKILVNSYSTNETLQNLTCFLLFPDEGFMDLSFSLNLRNRNNIPGYAPRMALSSTAG